MQLSDQARRPSVPNLPRPSFDGISLTSLDLPSAFPASSLDRFGFEYGFGLGFSDPQTLPLFQPRDIEVDFNRAPSQLSMYGCDYDSDDEVIMAGDAPRAISTPAIARTEHVFGGRLSSLHSYRPTSPSAASSDDTITSPSHNLAKSQSVPNLQSQAQPNFSMYQTPAHARHRWSDDSLISPPKLSDIGYNREDEDPFARMQDEDGPMAGDEQEEPDDMLGAFVAAPCPDEDDDDDEVMPILRRVHTADTEATSQLKDMLDKLVLDDRQEGYRRSLPLRTRSIEEPGRSSLGAPMELSAPRSRQGRDRRGTIRASDFLPAATGNRTRSGTIRASESTGIALPKRTRSGTVIGPAKSDNTTLSRPPPSSRKRSGTDMKVDEPTVTEEPVLVDHPMDVDEEAGEAVQDSGIGMGPSLMESDDELLLKSDDPIPGGVTRLGRKLSCDRLLQSGLSEDDLGFYFNG